MKGFFKPSGLWRIRLLVKNKRKCFGAFTKPFHKRMKVCKGVRVILKAYWQNRHRYGKKIHVSEAAASEFNQYT